ncbi:MAG: hypothetical protein LBJ00_18365 [Planctomycetaceae bacterium]|jgi:hypothetical protein|nr:hypothetical protein [Planctomycetaceae bacterium]
MIEKSYEKFTKVLHRLEVREKLRTVAEMFGEDVNTPFVSEDKVVADLCSLNKGAFFVCSVNFSCTKSPSGGEHSCIGNYMLCPENAGYACLNSQQNGCANVKEIFECATFSCGRQGLPANGFGCAGKQAFLCNGSMLYGCVFDFKCSEPDNIFLCTYKHSCNKDHKCGDGQTAQQNFLCGIGDKDGDN